MLPLVGVSLLPLGQVELFVEVVRFAGADLCVDGDCCELVPHYQHSRFTGAFVGVDYGDPLCAHDGFYGAGVCDSEPLSFGASARQGLAPSYKCVVHVGHGVLHSADRSAWWL